MLKYIYIYIYIYIFNRRPRFRLISGAWQVPQKAELLKTTFAYLINSTKFTDTHTQCR